MAKPSEQFFEIIDDESYGILPAPTEAQLAVNVLQEYLLGEDYYIVDPLPNCQANTILVHDILLKYSRRYRKEWKRRAKYKRNNDSERQ